MESDKHNTKHTRATIKTIDKYLNEEEERDFKYGAKNGGGFSKQHFGSSWGSSFMSSKAGCRNYLEQRLGNTMLEESRYPQNNRNNSASYEAEIAKLSKEVEEQKTIIQLQKQIIDRLVAQVEENRQPDRQEKKLMEAFSGISEVRHMLEEALR